MGWGGERPVAVLAAALKVEPFITRPTRSLVWATLTVVESIVAEAPDSRVGLTSSMKTREHVCLLLSKLKDKDDTLRVLHSIRDPIPFAHLWRTTTL